MVFFIVSLQFLKAVGVAILFAVIRRDKPWKRFKGLFMLALSRDKVPVRIEIQRNLECKKCPLFYKPLQTCGSPLDKQLVDEDGKPMGCWCYMPMKNRISDATCWLNDHTETVGWPKELYGTNT